MEKRNEIEKLWSLANYYNTLSHEYSNMADALTKIAQEMEDDQ